MRTARTRRIRKLKPLTDVEIQRLERALRSSTRGRWTANSTTLFVGNGKSAYRLAMPARAETGRDTSADPWFIVIAHALLPRLLAELRHLRAAVSLPEPMELARVLCDADREFASIEDGFPLESLASWEALSDEDPTKREYIAAARHVLGYLAWRRDGGDAP